MKYISKYKYREHRIRRNIKVEYVQTLRIKYKQTHENKKLALKVSNGGPRKMPNLYVCETQKDIIVTSNNILKII